MVLSKRTRYSFDRCMAHIEERLNLFNIEQVAFIKQHRNYEALCLAECVNFPSLMHKKYKLKV